MASLFVVCCALSLAIIPAATARRDRGGQTSTSTSTGASAQTAPAEAGTAAGAVAEGRRAGAHGAGGQRPPAGAQRPRRGARSTHGQGQSQGSSAQEEQGAESAAEATPAPAAAGTPGAAAKHAGGRHKRTEPTQSREAEKRSKAKSGRPPAESGSASGSSTAPAPVTAGAQPSASAPSASVASAAVAANPSAAAGTPASAVDAHPTHAVHRSTRAGRHGVHRRANPAAATPARVATAAATAIPATPSVGTRGARTGAHVARTDARASPLATTITKIVDVVPAAVRVLIAGLLAVALALAVRSGVAAVRARRLERQRRELLEDVGLLQAALLPVPPARLGPVGTSAAYRPAAGPGAGGDFYDVFALADGQLAVIVGDVSGHGRQALPHTALVRFTLRAYLEAGLSPRDAVQTAGAVLERQLGGAFATVVAATYQPRERVLVYACAGHPPPLVLGAGTGAAAVAPVTVCTPPPLGVGMRTGTRQTVVSIPGRAQVCFYTDGVTEARIGSELFGAQRLADTLAELGPHASAAAVLERVAERADARPDDMAACVLGVEGDDDAPTALVEELEVDRDEAASDRTVRFLLACGVEPADVADAVDSARVAAGRAGTVVFELRRGNGPPQLTLRREHLSYLHARRADVGAAR
jgi:hypothetical protein